MRSRKTIEGDVLHNFEKREFPAIQANIIEVLLDIRELLEKKRRPAEITDAEYKAIAEPPEEQE